MNNESQEEHKSEFDNNEQSLNEDPIDMQRTRPALPEHPVPARVYQPTLQQWNGSFTDEEVQNLREIFDLFDKEQSGHIEVKDLETIMGSL